MRSSTMVLLSGALTFGVPLLLAVRELVSLRRDQGGSGGSWTWRRTSAPVPPRPRGGTREQQRELPACLIEAARGAPVASPERTPELETAG